MSWNPLRPRGRRRSTLAAAAAAAALLLVPTAAFAGGGTDDSGPGSSNGGMGSYHPVETQDWACGQNIGKIFGVLYNRMDGRWVAHQAAVYPGCRPGDSPGWSVSGKAELCPTGFEVYRFYGYAGQAPTAVTRSRLNLTSWCAAEPTYTFTAQTSWDANPAAAPGSPDYIAQANSKDQKQNLLPYLVGRRENKNLTASTPTPVLGSCTSVSKDNPLIAWLSTASPADQVSYRAALGDAYLKIAVKKVTTTVNGHPVTVTRTYPLSAASELGMKGVTGYRYSVLPDQSTHPGTAPKADAKGSHYYLSGIQWDTRKCETPFNFAVVTDASTGKQVGKTPVFGTCYIPVMRQARQMLKGNRAVWDFQELGRGYGERYSLYYKNNHDLGDAVPASWRTAMKNDYLDRSQAATNSFYGPQGQQVLPANHYPSETNTGSVGKAYPASPAQAASDLASGAKCRMGNRFTLDLPKTPPPTQTATMNLKVLDTKVLQSGGSSYTAQFRVQGNQSQLICEDGQPCGTRAILSALSYTMDLVGKNGFTKCAPGQMTGCSYRITGYTPGGPNKDGVLTAEFYNATAPRQSVQLVLGSLTATYQFAVATTGLNITGYDPVNGQPYQVQSGTIDSTQSRNFTPGAAGTPLSLRKSGPAYTLDYPVISAVDVPVG